MVAEEFLAVSESKSNVQAYFKSLLGSHFFILIEDTLIDFRERGRAGERGRETLT